MSKKVVLFELNEVPWRVLEDHVAARPHGALSRILGRAKAYETHAEERELHPWITWPSLHRGVGEDRHTITDFNQELGEIDEAYPPLWRLLAERGVPVGVCGSVHSNPCPKDPSAYSFYLPDPFAQDARAWPAELVPFQDFNLAMSRKSARNVSSQVSWSKVGALVTGAPRLGLRARTFASLGRQLADERLRGWTQVRRRTYQSLLAFDVFAKQLETKRPAFSTFFTNHIASTLHRFWAAAYPRDYARFDCTEDWVDRYAGEVRWVMDRADDMLARLDAFAQRHSEYELWIASSMGQAATEATRSFSQVYLRDLDVFLRRLGVEPSSWTERPAMAPRVIFALDGGRDRALEAKLARIELADRGPLGWEHLGQGVYRIHPGVQKDVGEAVVRFQGEPHPFAEFGFRNLVLQDQVGQTAYHVPTGLLLRAGAQAAKGPRERLSTQQVAPMLLDALGEPRPAYMGSAPGRLQVEVA